MVEKKKTFPVHTEISLKFRSGLYLIAVNITKLRFPVIEPNESFNIH